jgi:hypothetical protein
MGGEPLQPIYFSSLLNPSQAAAVAVWIGVDGGGKLKLAGLEVPQANPVGFAWLSRPGSF